MTLRETIARALEEHASRSLDDDADRARVTDAVLVALMQEPDAAAVRQLFANARDTGGRTVCVTAGPSSGLRLGLVVDAAHYLAGGSDVLYPPDFGDPTVEGL